MKKAEFNGEIIKVNDNKYYVELDQIRLIVEGDKVVGWYRPSEVTHD